MKKQTVSQFIFLLTASIFFFSCGNKMNKNTGSLEFDSIQVNETAHLSEIQPSPHAIWLSTLHLPTSRPTLA